MTIPLLSLRVVRNIGRRTKKTYYEKLSYLSGDQDRKYICNIHKFERITSYKSTIRKRVTLFME